MCACKDGNPKQILFSGNHAPLTPPQMTCRNISNYEYIIREQLCEQAKTLHGRKKKTRKAKSSLKRPASICAPSYARLLRLLRLVLGLIGESYAGTL